MLVLLLLTAVFVPCWYACKRSVSNGMVEINHVTTFSFGFLFYWITPLAVRIATPDADFPLSSVWIDLFQEQLIAPYAISCIALYLCFVLGDSFGTRLFTRKERKSERVPLLGLCWITAGASLLMAYSMLRFRAPLMRTATPGDVPAQAARGAVTACVVLMAAVALIYSLDHPLTTWRQRLLSFYFLPLIGGAAILVAVGSRLGVASLLVMFAIYHTSAVGRVRLRTVLIGLLLFACFFGAVGRWRETGSFGRPLFNVFEEPIFCSLSLVHYLSYRGIAWINFPHGMAGDLRVLVPTVLMPNKVERLQDPYVYAPLGGLHSFVSFNLAFGLLGSAVFWFLLPMGFRYLRSRSSLTLFATMYIMCSGWLTFSFFRDPFRISLLKEIFEFSLIAPVAIVYFARLMSWSWSLLVIRRAKSEQHV